MGKNGNITMSNLQTATGIGNDKLSPHHPNGAGNTTAMGDFLTDHIGRRIASPEWSASNGEGMQTDINGDPYGTNGFDTRLSIPDTTVNGDDGLPQASDTTMDGDGNTEIDGNVELTTGDQFWIRIGTGIEANQSLGEHFLEQVVGRGLSGSNGSFFINSQDGLTETGNVQYGTDGGTPNRRVIDVQVEVTGLDIIHIEWKFEDGMNTDATNYGDPSTQTGVSSQANGLRFTTKDAQSSTVYVDEYTVTFSNKGGSGSFFDCALSNRLDNGGTSGDDTFSTRVNVNVNDPANKYSTVYKWIYADDNNRTLGCPGQDSPIVKFTGSCDDTITLDNDGGNISDVTVRVVITDDASATTKIDQKEITVTLPSGTAGEGQTTKTYNNQSATC